MLKGVRHDLKTHPQILCAITKNMGMHGAYYAPPEFFLMICYELFLVYLTERTQMFQYYANWITTGNVWLKDKIE